jgi:hypothetical protein
MIVLVCGARDSADRDHVFSQLDAAHFIAGFGRLIHGGAPGVDSFAGEWALSRSVPQVVYPAEWDRYGRSAGPRRNAQMLAEGKPDIVFAFPGGIGTADMVRRAERAGVYVARIAGRKP